MTNSSGMKIADSIVATLQAQLMMIEKLKKKNIKIDDYVLGYLWGFTDGSLDGLDISYDGNEEYCTGVMMNTFGKVLPKYIGNSSKIMDLLDRATNEQVKRTNHVFVSGLSCGFDEAYRWYKSKCDSSELPKGLLEWFDNRNLKSTDVIELAETLRLKGIFYLNMISKNMRKNKSFFSLNRWSFNIPYEGKVSYLILSMQYIFIKGYLVKNIEEKEERKDFLSNLWLFLASDKLMNVTNMLQNSANLIRTLSI